MRANLAQKPLNVALPYDRDGKVQRTHPMALNGHPKNECEAQIIGYSNSRVAFVIVIIYFFSPWSVLNSL